MSTTWLESLMYEVSGLFLAPVLLLLAVLFAYSFFLIGAFLMQALQRKKALPHYLMSLKNLENDVTAIAVPGYPLLTLAVHHPDSDRDQLDIEALKQLEGVRSISRLAPMLGLIATMVPMGPALKSLSDGNIQGISENLVVAFSAVIFGLVISSITFWIASYKKRWLAIELVDVDRSLRQRTKTCNEI
ncbi:MAG: hypothetical protein CL692_00075 [Cellvibrionales bacterium]|nr:hypothetical protein [Cellvibrionales bacterium]